MPYNLRSMKLQKLQAEPEGTATASEVAKLQAALNNTVAQKRTYEKRINQQQTLLQEQPDQEKTQLLEWTLFMVLMLYVTVVLELPPLSVVLACIISAIDLFPKSSRWSWMCPIRTTSWASVLEWYCVCVYTALLTWLKIPFFLAIIGIKIVFSGYSCTPWKCLFPSGQFIFALVSSRALTTFLCPSLAVISGFVLASVSPQLLKALSVTYPELKPVLKRLKTFFADDGYDCYKDSLAGVLADAWKSDLMSSLIKMSSPMMKQVETVLQNFGVFKSMCEVLLFLWTLGSKLALRMVAVATLTLFLWVIPMQTW